MSYQLSPAHKKKKREAKQEAKEEKEEAGESFAKLRALFSSETNQILPLPHKAKSLKKLS